MGEGLRRACCGFLLVLAGCASGPTVSDAQERLAKGDAEGALLAAREAQKGPLESDEQLLARRVAFEACLALGRSDEAARDFQNLQIPVREREKLREHLAASTLAAAFQSADAGRRAIAASELPLAAGHPRFLALVETALADREPFVRRVAIGVVARLPEATACPRLVRALEDTDEDVRATASRALAKKLGDPRPGESPEARTARAALLVHPAPNALVRAEPAPLPDLESARMRRAFLESDRLVPRSVAELTLALESRIPAIAPDAARLLAERGGAAATPVLVRALEDGESPARVAAARALGQVGGPEAVPPLVRALENEDGALRRAAAEALARAGGPAALDDLSRAIANPLDDSDIAAAAAVLAIEARTGSPAALNAATPQEGP